MNKLHIIYSLILVFTQMVVSCKDGSSNKHYQYYSNSSSSYYMDPADDILPNPFLKWDIDSLCKPNPDPTWEHPGGLRIFMSNEYLGTIPWRNSRPVENKDIDAWADEIYEICNERARRAKEAKAKKRRPNKK